MPELSDSSSLAWVQMILQKPGAGGCNWGWPGSWLFSFPSITAFRVISDSEGTEAEGEQDLFMTWHQQKYPDCSESVLDLKSADLVRVRVLSLTNYKNLGKSINFLRDIPYHSVTTII